MDVTTERGSLFCNITIVKQLTTNFMYFKSEMVRMLCWTDDVIFQSCSTKSIKGVLLYLRLMCLVREDAYRSQDITTLIDNCLTDFQCLTVKCVQHLFLINLDSSLRKRVTVLRNNSLHLERYQCCADGFQTHTLSAYPTPQPVLSFFSLALSCQFSRPLVLLSLLQDGFSLLFD